MPKKNPKSKRGDAERAAEWYAHEVLGCIITRRAVRTQWQKVDFFGADVVGKDSLGHHYYLQATAGQYSAVTARRRKLEVIPWQSTDTVGILQLVQTPDPANARRKKWFFRVHKFLRRSGHGTKWKTEEKAVEVPREWFRAWKNKNGGGNAER